MCGKFIYSFRANERKTKDICWYLDLMHLKLSQFLAFSLNFSLSFSLALFFSPSLFPYFARLPSFPLRFLFVELICSTVPFTYGFIVTGYSSWTSLRLRESTYHKFPPLLLGIRYDVGVRDNLRSTKCANIDFIYRMDTIKLNVS